MKHSYLRIQATITQTVTQCPNNGLDVPIEPWRAHSEPAATVLNVRQGSGEGDQRLRQVVAVAAISIELKVCSGPVDL